MGKLGRSVTNAEQLVLNNPREMFANFYSFYLANRKEAPGISYVVVAAFSVQLEIQLLGVAHIISSGSHVGV